MVGDRIDTDVAGAAALGWESLLVLTRPAPPSVRPAAETDVESIERLLRQADVDSEGVGWRLAETFVAATEHGDVVGTCAIELFGPFAHLRSVAVAPTVRGAHLGTMLCAHAAHAARAAAGGGAEELFAVTETAGGFFESLGFEPRGSRTALPDPVAATPLIRDRCTEQAVVFRLDLNTSGGN